MRIRLLILLAIAALAAPPAGALAQDGNPFDGLPPVQPTPAPTAEPADTDDDNITRDTLYVIGGALVLTFFGIGWWITRDARRKLPQDERDDRRRLREEGPHRHERQAKAKARAKGRAQRQARKAGRKARR
jgi:hypothetical protein